MNNNDDKTNTYLSLRALLKEAYSLYDKPVKKKPQKKKKKS